MSSYENSAHTGRLVIVPRVRDAFADLYVSNKPRGATPTLLVATQPPIELFQVNEFGSKNGERDPTQDEVPPRPFSEASDQA